MYTGHKQGAKTTRKRKKTRERRDTYTIECYQSLNAILIIAKIVDKIDE